MPLNELIHSIPKAELHLHIEGTLEPKLMLEFAKRTGMSMGMSAEELKRAYRFKDLQDFLNIYYKGTDTLRTHEDFYDLTMHYLQKAKENNVVHAEIFYDPQAHIRRGIKFETFTEGIISAMKNARRNLEISSNLILSFLRDLPEENAIRVLDEATSYIHEIKAVGLDSAELGNPPSKFSKAFEIAKDMGLLRVAHAGEEGPPSYIWEAIEILNVERIDHGVKAIEDPNLMKLLAKERIPLTMCPLSNKKLNVIPDLKNYPVREFLKRGIMATINSDDPAYFGGYVNENYTAIQRALNLTPEEICTLASNSILASFIPEERKREILEKIKGPCEKHGVQSFNLSLDSRA